MFKHEVQYVDFNGTERKEDLYFHLSVPEVIRLEAEIGGDIEAYAKELHANQNLPEMIKFIEKLLLNAYGKKTSDGKSFYKDKKTRDEFEYSQAYAEIFEQMLTVPGLAGKFGSAVAEKRQAVKNQVNPVVINKDNA